MTEPTYSNRKLQTSKKEYYNELNKRAREILFTKHLIASLLCGLGAGMNYYSYKRPLNGISKISGINKLGIGLLGVGSYYFGIGAYLESKIMRHEYQMQNIRASHDEWRL